MHSNQRRKISWYYADILQCTIKLITNCNILFSILCGISSFIKLEGSDKCNNVVIVYYNVPIKKIICNVVHDKK